MGHIINLIIQRFLFGNIIQIEELEIYNFLEKIRNYFEIELKKLKFRTFNLFGKFYNIITYIKNFLQYKRKFKIIIN